MSDDMSACNSPAVETVLYMPLMLGLQGVNEYRGCQPVPPLLLFDCGVSHISRCEQTDEEVWSHRMPAHSTPRQPDQRVLVLHSSSPDMC